MFNIGIISSFASLVPNGLLNDLISYYKMDTNGSFPDIQGSNDGTINGATFIASALINGGYDFDGSNDFIGLPNQLSTDLIGSSAIGFSLWINRDTLIDRELLLFRTTSLNAGLQLTVIGNKIRIGVRSQTSDSSTFVTGSINLSSTGQYYHIVGAIDYANKQIISYIDGVKDIDATAPNFGSLTHNYSTNSISLGSAEGTGSPSYFNGKIDELGFRAKVFTQGDATELFNAGAGLSYNNFTN